MKVYELKEDIKTFRGDPLKGTEGLTGKKLHAALLKNMEVAYKKGERFIPSKLIMKNGKPLMYPANFDTNNYNVLFLGERMDETIDGLARCWSHTVRMQNILFKSGKFKKVEDKSITETPEQKLFLSRIEAGIRVAKNRIENSNAVLKELNTFKVRLTS